MLKTAVQPSTTLRITPEDDIEEKAALARAKAKEGSPEKMSTQGPLQLFASGSLNSGEVFR
jgi:hypothetical protein